MAIATLTVDLEARFAKLEQGFNKSEQLSEKTAQKIQKSFDDAGKALGTIFAGYSLNKVFQSMVTDVSATEDELSKLSQRTGVTVEDLSRLEYAASLSGVSMDDLSNALKQTAKNMADAKRGTGDALPALEALGLKQDLLNGKFGTANKLLEAVAEKFSGYADGAKKSALAQKLFGDAGDRLIPLLNNGASGIKGMGDEAERFGVVVDTKAAKAAEQFNDNVTRLEKRFQGLRYTIGNEVIPILDTMVKYFTDTTGQTKKLNDEVSTTKVIMQTLAVLGANVAYVFKEVGTEIGGIGAQLDRLAHGDLKGFSSIHKMMLEDAKAARAELDAFEARVMGTAESVKQTSEKSSSNKPQAPDMKNASGSMKLSDPLGDLISDINDKLKPAEAALAKFNQIQLDAQTSAAGLTNSEKQFYDLINDPAWANMADPWKDLVTNQFEAADTAEKMAKAQQRLSDLIAATPTAQMEKQRETVAFLTQALEDSQKGVGDLHITVEQYNEAINAYLGNIAAPLEKTGDKLSVYAEQAARNMQDAFANFLFDPFGDGVNGMAQQFAVALEKMAAQAAASQIFDAVGQWGKDNAGAGGSLGLFASIASIFAGGKADGGPTMPGSLYEVAERGPELYNSAGKTYLLTGNSGGTVTPNSKVGGQTTVNQISIHMPSGSTSETRRAAADGVRTALRAASAGQRYA